MGTRIRNSIEYQVSGRYALLSAPALRMGGRKGDVFRPNLSGAQGDYGADLPAALNHLGRGRSLTSLPTGRMNTSTTALRAEWWSAANGATSFWARANVWPMLEAYTYGEGVSCYDGSGEIDLGLMFHSFAYPDEAGKNELGVRLWRAKMVNGEIHFPRPKECDPALYRFIRPMKPKKFGGRYGNFSGTEDTAEDFSEEGDRR